MILKLSLLLAGAVAFGALVSAAPKQYTFKDPKGVNHIVFMLDAPLEFISGTGRGVDGTLEYDPANPSATKAMVTLSADSLSVPNPTMKDHMHGQKWMDVSEHPSIRFELDGFEPSETEGQRVKGTATGKLSMLGTTREMEVPATITFVEGGAAQRGRGEGELVVVRSDFTINLSDFGINLNPAEKLKVSDEVQIRAVLAGYPQP
ncbi:MAG: YceI family protein [Opitutales bacterium]